MPDKMSPEQRAELEKMVRDAVAAELRTFGEVLGGILTPFVDEVREMQASCRQLVAGQALVEKLIAYQQPERESWEGDDDGSAATR